MGCLYSPGSREPLRISAALHKYWVLNQLDELALVYYEIRDHLNLFLKLFHTLKKNKAINQRDIGRLLRYAIFDLPSLENKIQRLSRDVVDMEWRKKHLRDEVARLISNKSQLENLQKRYQMEIEQKKHIISNLDQQLNQKISALEEKLS
jgi:predicted  nucleic acid-binding Zn-ribbon protein